MKKLLILNIFLFFFTIIEANELPNCEWNNSDGNPCLTIFSAPNTSDISDESWGKILLALSIGPATNWGKKLTYEANNTQSLVALIFPL